MSAPARRGRRPAGADTRGAIISAARAEFGSRGYDGTTIRGIARAAEVDPRLVHHYFDGKVDIFVATMDFPVRPQDVVRAVLGPGPDGIGERLVRFFLGVANSPDGRQRIRGILGAITTNDEAARMVQQFVERELMGRIADELGVDRPRLRASLAASHMIGMAVFLLVLRLEPLVSADPEELVAIVAPTLQRYLTDPDL